MRAWLNLQLRKRAHPVGDESILRRRRNKENCDGWSKATMFQAVSRKTKYAGMAELADALDSGSSESNFMEVQVLLPAPKKTDEFRSSVFFLHRGLEGERE